MKNLILRGLAFCLAGLVLTTGACCARAGTGTVQGQLTAATMGSTLAQGTMIELLNPTDATVAQNALVNPDNSFAVSVPAGAYRVCFRFANTAGYFSPDRSFYNADYNPEPKPGSKDLARFCLAEGTVVQVAEGATTVIAPQVSYNLDPALGVTTPVKMDGTVVNTSGAFLPGITVDLLDTCNANVIQTTTTDAEGWWGFGKDNGHYPWKVRYSDPSGQYATSFEGADDFIGATPVGPVLEESLGKVLQQRVPDLEVAPLVHNFGDVALPGSSLAIITIANQGAADLHVAFVALLEANTTYITVKSAPPVALTLGPGQSCEVALEFEPRTIGAASATLAIASDDPDEGSVEVSLSGSGTASSAPPAEQIAATLVFIAESVNEGRLQGTGPAGAGSAHVQALMEQIKAASDLAAAGKLEAACKQLGNAMQRTDGLPKPPDFVAGPAAEELRFIIELTRLFMGCP